MSILYYTILYDAIVYYTRLNPKNRVPKVVLMWSSVPLSVKHPEASLALARGKGLATGPILSKSYMAVSVNWVSFLWMSL